MQTTGVIIPKAVTPDASPVKDLTLLVVLPAVTGRSQHQMPGRRGAGAEALVLVLLGGLDALDALDALDGWVIKLSVWLRQDGWMATSSPLTKNGG